MITLFQINYLLINNIFNSQSNLSLSNTILYIWKFSKLKNIIFFLFLSLAGLPPFIMFFIKFNYLINLLYKLNFIFIICIFLIFFLNMIFYIQIFFHKNINILIKFVKPHHRQYIRYQYIYLIVWFSFFIFLSIFFFSDYIFIFSLVIIGNI